MKRAGGRRFYRPQDIVVLHAVRRRLHEDGLTIKGVQKLHKEGGLRRLTGEDLAGDGAPAAPAAQPADRVSTSSRGAALRAILDDLEAAKARLDAVLAR
jgi:DNA-binding transcriptional MerR regulator